VNKVIEEQDNDPEINDIMKKVQTEDEKEANALGEIKKQEEKLKADQEELRKKEEAEAKHREEI
jgi:hypothetical protein